MDDKNIDKLSENEIDPKLHFDAFMGGVKDGGLRSVNSIYLTVCYIVENINGKVTKDVITKAMSEGGLANYFEVSDAVGKLIKSGTLLENGDGALSLNKNTGADIELVEKDLPYTVRERSIRLVQKIIAKEKYRRENEAKIVKTDNGYDVILNISDGDTEYMKLKLFATTIEQAEMMKEKFLTNPANVYEAVISGIFSNEE